MNSWIGPVAAVVAAAVIWAPAVAHSAPDAAPDHCQWRDEQAGGGAPYLACTDEDGASPRLAAPHDLTPATVASAEAGDPEAMTALGMFYVVAPAPVRNPEAGLAWLKKAAAKSYGPAMRDLGHIYNLGDGAAPDPVESARWYRAGADAGDIPSMGYLGSAYMRGRGVPRDYVEAMHWYRSAADHGLPEGFAGVGLLYANGLGVQKDMATAAEWFRKAADGGNGNALRYLAYMAANGLGMPKDETEAAKWRRLASARTQWARLPSDDEMQIAYPTGAAAKGIEGRVLFLCRVAADRSPHDCLRETEQPAGFGFTEAARSLIGGFRLAPGLPEGAPIVLPIHFKLELGREPRAMADSCAAYAIAVSRQKTLAGLPKWWARYWIALSKEYAAQAGEADSPDRLSAQVAEASDRLAEGKDRGIFGKLSRCSLR